MQRKTVRHEFLDQAAINCANDLTLDKICSAFLYDLMYFYNACDYLAYAMFSPNSTLSNAGLKSVAINYSTWPFPSSAKGSAPKQNHDLATNLHSEVQPAPLVLQTRLQWLDKLFIGFGV